MEDETRTLFGPSFRSSTQPFYPLAEGPANMLELQVVLDFACCNCAEPVIVTVRCEGNGLALKARAVASVDISCPSCRVLNRLFFEPTGTVRAVTLPPAPRPRTEPSMN
jgi:phage FluMu protein Com